MSSNSVSLLKSFHSNHPSFCRIAVIFGVFLCIFRVSESRVFFTLPEKLLKSVESQYGDFAKRRLIAWQTLIRDDSSTSDIEKLEKTNIFFNQMQFIDDIIHWKKADYWATPVEFLSTGGGDCEDFSLAKYFTLKALGVAEGKLNMTYVKALQLNQAHMVVTYYATPDAVPLVLDNLVPEIQLATKRKDLLPVYSFNGLGLWLAKSRGKGQKVGSSDRLKRWQDLLSRMPEGLN
ncbi:MAG: sulfate adenylyltransferase [Desulfobulbaceae bacterium]|nr:sulfate adenylyltransferase [Desulfobulbaceae bacterium]